MRRLALACALLAACGSERKATRRDGEWQPLPDGAEAIAGGGLPDGTLWFAGTRGQGWVQWTAPDGATREARYPSGRVRGAAATPSGDVWVVSNETSSDQLRLARIEHETGNTGATRSVTYAVGGDVYDVDALGEGVVAAGMHNPLVSGLLHGWLFTASPDGAAGLDVKLGRRGYGFLSAVTPLADGALATLGKLDNESGLAIVDAQGADVRFGPLFAGERTRADEVAELPDGDLIVIGFRIDGETVSTLAGRVVAERRGRDGTVRWSRTGEAIVSNVRGIAVVGEDVVALAATPGASPSLLVLRITGAGAITATPHDGPAIVDVSHMAAFLVRGADGALKLLQLDPRQPRYRLSAL